MPQSSQSNYASRKKIEAETKWIRSSRISEMLVFLRGGYITCTHSKWRLLG